MVQTAPELQNILVNLGFDEHFAFPIT